MNEENINIFEDEEDEEIYIATFIDPDEAPPLPRRGSDDFDELDYDELDYDELDYMDIDLDDLDEEDDEDDDF